MRIGIVTEGESEVSALPKLYPRIRSAFLTTTGYALMNPVKASLNPDGTLEHVAWGVAKALQILKGKGLHKVVVLIDREQRDECCGATAETITGALRRQEVWPFDLDVVLKNRTLENWLIADVEALRAQHGRFRIDEGAAREIAVAGADTLDAYVLLKKWTTSPPSYHKVRDSARIFAHAEPSRIASTSRSFRRFLRCLGHPAYAGQSRLPAVGEGGAD